MRYGLLVMAILIAPSLAAQDDSVTPGEPVYKWENEEGTTVYAGPEAEKPSQAEQVKIDDDASLSVVPSEDTEPNLRPSEEAMLDELEEEEEENESPQTIIVKGDTNTVVEGAEAGGSSAVGVPSEVIVPTPIDDPLTDNDEPAASVGDASISNAPDALSPEESATDISDAGISVGEVGDSRTSLADEDAEAIDSLDNNVGQSNLGTNTSDTGIGSGSIGPAPTN